MRRGVLLLAGASLFSAGWSTIMYQVEVMPGASVLAVKMDIPNPGGEVQVEIPKWAPGSYRYANYSQAISGVRAVAGGTAVAVEKSGETTWTVKSGGRDRVQFMYLVRAAVGAETHHWAGPATYMYVKGRKEEACYLKLNLPAGWKSACGLKEESAHSYWADDYDVLADNPVSVGMFTRDTYVSNGVPHEIVYHRGPVNLVDRAKVLRACQNISDTQAKMWDGLPFRKYVWHFAVTPGMGGGGGLEHLSSTQITMAAGLNYGTISVMSHEYFHAWNVKRIRSKVLGPFDYQTLPQTGALWWLEGVTDYYADVLLYRGRWSGEKELFGSVTGNVASVRRNQERFNISPYDSSYRVREAAGGRGNSQGLGVSYYNTGWLLGLCLDIELRVRTSGAKNLDSISLDLWRMNKDSQPGFEEGEIRNLLVKHGGAGMGPLYDTWVMKPGELPVEAQLAKIGLEMKQVDEAFADYGANFAPLAGGRVVVRQARAESAFKNGDVVVSVGSVNFPGTMMSGMQAKLDAAEKAMLAGAVDVVVEREGAKSTTKVTAKRSMRKVTQLMPLRGASSQAVRLRAGWLSQY